MPDNQKVELTPIEATAYWWVRTIRAKVYEVEDNGPLNKDERMFAKLFSFFSEVNWRCFYLQLIELIKEDITGFIPSEAHEMFFQDTAYNGHNRINEIISIITEKKVPDIRLSGRSAKDIVVFTSFEKAIVLHKSSSDYQLDSKYDADYVLTGNEEELHFKNLILSTLIDIKNKSENFCSVSTLRDGFCKEYSILNSSGESLDEIKTHFNRVFDELDDKHIISGRSHFEKYYFFPKERYYIGLDDCWDLANHYGNIVLGLKKPSSGQCLSRNIN